MLPIGRRWEARDEAVASAHYSGILYGVGMTDPLTVGIALAALVAIGLAAGTIPARRATRVDPLVALRSE